MKRLTIFSAVCLIVLGSLASGEAQGQAMNTLSKKEKRAGWKLLFNGKDLEGWHTYLQQDATPGWQVKDGIIVLDPSAPHGGDLTTNAEYENYELSLEWKISKGGNSGVIFNVHEDPRYRATYLTGPEMQVLDNKDADDNKKANHLAGSLYDIIAADPSAVHPAEEWNHIIIRLDKGHLTLKMNGKEVVETQMWDDNWKQLVAKCKFKNTPEFGIYKKGHIALQDHGNVVSFRNIMIREL